MDLSTNEDSTSRSSSGGQVAGANDFCRFEFEASREHREPAPELLLGGCAQVVAPADAPAQSLLPRRRTTTAAGEQCVPVGQPLQDLLGRNHPQPRRRQFDRQRQPVQFGADAGDGGLVVVGELETRHRGGRPIGEQRHRVVAGQPAAASARGPRRETPTAGRRSTASPPIPKASRLVARTRTSGHARNNASASSAADSTTCSQLSSTSSSLRGARNSTSTSRNGRADSSRTPRAAATASRSSDPSCSSPNSTSHTPSRKSGRAVARGPQRQPRLADPSDAGQRDHPRRGKHVAAPRTARCDDRRSWSDPRGGSRWCGEHLWSPPVAGDSASGSARSAMSSTGRP